MHPPWFPYPRNRRAMTLMELLVASILMGLVMIGIVAANATIFRQKSAEDKYSLTLQKTTAAMEMIRRHAYLTTGHSSDANTPAETGIDINPAGSDTGICFRNDFLRTPEDYSDDHWHCFCHGASFNMYYLERDNASCNTTPPPVYNFEKHMLQLVPGSPTFFTIVNNGSDIGSIRIQLHAMFDRSVSDTPDPEDNPDVIIATEINPPTLSR